MSSTIATPRGLETVNNSPEISRYYGKNNLPYTSTAQVLSEVLQAKRYKGQTFRVNDEEWWFNLGVTNADLVLKEAVGGCLTAECVQSLPTFNNDFEAAVLPDYTPYKTSTGELRYKLPSGSRILYWIDSNMSIDSEMWID